MKWEYKIIYFSAKKWTSTGLPSGLGTEFDRLGNDGWELVRVEPLLKPSILAGSYTSGFLAFFKKARE